MRDAGLKNVRVIDGGIVAWARGRNQAGADMLGRLPDTDVAHLLFDPETRVVVHSASLADAVGDLPNAHSTSPARGVARTVVLVDPSVSPADIHAALAQARVLPFYWVGTPDSLRRLLASDLAQERKRREGPGERLGCSAK